MESVKKQENANKVSKSGTDPDVSKVNSFNVNALKTTNRVGYFILKLVIGQD